MNKLLTRILTVVCVGALCVSGYQLLNMFTEYRKGTDLYDNVAQQAVISVSSRPAASSSAPSGTSAPASSSASIPAEEEKPQPAAPVTVTFETLLQQNEDVVGWIYCEDTPLNYPVVQSEDNDYYLRRMLDGSYNESGTIFMDYRNDPEMKDRSTYIYGHNMKNDAMFGILPKYSERSFYEKHPVIWYFTEEHTFRIEPIAAMVVAPDSDVYNVLTADEEELKEHIEWLISQSDFETDVDLDEVGKIVTLSTCSYEYDDARYVVIGSLTEAE